MKLLLTELIEGKYYYCYSSNEEIRYYFKFKKLIENNIHCYGFQLEEFKSLLDYEECEESFCVYKWYDKDCDVLEEANFEVILNYLPDCNIDKLNYIRRQKIKNLLKYE